MEISLCCATKGVWPQGKNPALGGGETWLWIQNLSLELPFCTWASHLDSHFHLIKKTLNWDPKVVLKAKDAVTTVSILRATVSSKSYMDTIKATTISCLDNCNSLEQLSDFTLDPIPQPNCPSPLPRRSRHWQSTDACKPQTRDVLCSDLTCGLQAQVKQTPEFWSWPGGPMACSLNTCLLKVPLCSVFQTHCSTVL